MFFCFFGDVGVIDDFLKLGNIADDLHPCTMLKGIREFIHQISFCLVPILPFEVFANQDGYKASEYTSEKPFPEW